MASPQKVGRLQLWYTDVINNERLYYTTVGSTNRANVRGEDICKIIPDSSKLMRRNTRQISPGITVNGIQHNFDPLDNHETYGTDLLSVIIKTEFGDATKMTR